MAQSLEIRSMIRSAVDQRTSRIESRKFARGISLIVDRVETTNQWSTTNEMLTKAGYPVKPGSLEERVTRLSFLSRLQQLYVERDIDQTEKKVEAEDKSLEARFGGQEELNLMIADAMGHFNGSRRGIVMAARKLALAHVFQQELNQILSQQSSDTERARLQAFVQDGETIARPFYAADIAYRDKTRAVGLWAVVESVSSRVAEEARKRE